MVLLASLVGEQTTSFKELRWLFRLEIFFSFFRGRFVIGYFYSIGFCTGKGWAILLRLAGIGNLGAVREEGQENFV